MLPFAARQHFLEHGYAVIRSVLSDEMTTTLRRASLEAASARRRQLCEMPPIDTIFRRQSSFSDPSLKAMASHLEKRRYLLQYHRFVKRKRRERKRLLTKFLKGRKMEELTSEEIYQLGVLLQEEVLSRDGSKQDTRHGVKSVMSSERTIHNDPQMLKAISDYRANLWMTHQGLQAILRNDAFSRELGRLAESVGGIDRPVVFSDSPIYREPYGSGTAYHCTAPCFGARTTSTRPCVAVTLMLFTFEPTPLCLEPHILEHSHRLVRAHLSHHPKTLQRLFSPFLLSEAHVPFQLQHFPFAKELHGKPLISPENESNPLSAPAPDRIQAGDVVVVDPHTMLAFGPNCTSESELVYRLHVVSESAAPYMRSPSWIRGWRSLPQEVNFASPVVFPKLF